MPPIIARKRGARRPKTAPATLPASLERSRFRRVLLRWYDRHGRDLPWRTTDDPYHILVSEMMLQQTQVDRVLPKYHEWLGKYPSLEALASADEGDVSETWRPLGYNIRPKRLHSTARATPAFLRPMTDRQTKQWLDRPYLMKGAGKPTTKPRITYEGAYNHQVGCSPCQARRAPW